MTLIKNGELADDSFVFVDDDGALPPNGAVVVGLALWQTSRDELLQRSEAIGLMLKSDQPPELIGDGLQQLAVIALEFPAFREGDGDPVRQGGYSGKLGPPRICR